MSILFTRRLSEVAPEEIRWLWHGRIARGKLTLIVGDPGSGKSYLSLALAAAVTSGSALPDDDATREIASVILWNGEDGLADTIRVRAGLCDADLERLHVIESARNSAGRLIAFGLGNLPELSQRVREIGDVGMVVVDPLAALLANVDAHRDTSVRSTLQPLVDFAREHNVAVVALAHTNKSSLKKAIYRVGGSLGFVALARTVLLVGADESGRRAIVPIKANICGLADAVTFAIDEGTFLWGDVAPDITAERLMAGPQPSLRKAQDAILRALQGGELSARDLERRIIDEDDVARKTFERARAALCDVGEIERHGGGRHGPVRWRLSELPIKSSRPHANGRDERLTAEAQVCATCGKRERCCIIDERFVCKNCSE